MPYANFNDKTITIVGTSDSNDENNWGDNIARQSHKMGSGEVCEITVDGTGELEPAIRRSHIVWFATPDNITTDYLKRYRRVFPEKSVIEMGTTKPHINLFADLDDEGASVCSTHPMVRPDSPLVDQPAIVMPIGKNGEHAERAAIDVYSGLKMRIEKLAIEQHADMMAIVQLIPHLLQRVQARLLSQVLELADLCLLDILRIAPANFICTNAALGRVAAQRPGISAKIINTARTTELGRIILVTLQNVLRECLEEGVDLETMFIGDAETLDPTGKWAGKVKNETDVHLEAAGNFRRGEFFIYAGNNTPGKLAEVTQVLAKIGISLTAITSQVFTDANGDESARFRIGYDPRQPIDWDKLSTIFVEHHMKLEHNGDAAD